MSIPEGYTAFPDHYATLEITTECNITRCVTTFYYLYVHDRPCKA